MWPLYLPAGFAVVCLTVGCIVKSKIVKSLISFLVLIAMFITAVLLAAFVLPDFLGVNSAWVSFAVGGGVFAVSMLFVWKPFKQKTRRIAALSITGAVIAISAVFAGPEIYKRSIPEAPEEDVNLRQYMPFGDEGRETLVKTLDGESTLKLNDNLPRLDGATALYPLYSAFVRATYPEAAYFPYYDLRGEGSGEEPVVVCSTTGLAFENLIEGYADMVFLMGVSDGQRAMAEAKGLELILTPIGREAFVFFVNAKNTAGNLSTEDIKRIYSGEVTNWQEVGGKNDDIRAYQRPDESGSQTMLIEILKGSPLMPAPKEDIYNLMMGMYQRVAGYRNYKNSLGYSFLFYIKDMINGNKVKFLSIDGAAPTRENIENDTYPFADDFYAVTVKSGGEYLNQERTDSIDKLLDWILSQQGQFLVESTGYVPLLNANE